MRAAAVYGSMPVADAQRTLPMTAARPVKSSASASFPVARQAVAVWASSRFSGGFWGGGGLAPPGCHGQRGDGSEQ
jgi:hypothetical protein